MRKDDLIRMRHMLDAGEIRGVCLSPSIRGGACANVSRRRRTSFLKGDFFCKVVSLKKIVII